MRNPLSFTDNLFVAGNGSRFDFSPLLLLLAIISAVIIIMALLLSAFTPNFVFVIRASASNAVEIRRKTKNNEYTGFDEVIAGKDADKAIKEIGALIHDVQIMGVPRALEKWQKETA